MSSHGCSFASVAGRSPCGERGLKYIGLVHKLGIKMSLPVRGAWIEMFARLSIYNYHWVAPRAGSVD